MLVGDGGFAGHWTGLLYETKRAGRHYVADRGFASIGYGLPGAIGAQLGVGPKRRVAALTGDGGFNMTLGDLETARRVGAACMVFVVNNAASGYVKALQHAVYGEGKYQSSDLVEMDYAAIANAHGLPRHPRRGPGAAGGRDRARGSPTRARRRWWTWSSRATRRRCCRASTAAPSPWRRATGRYDRRRGLPP